MLGKNVARSSNGIKNNKKSLTMDNLSSTKKTENMKIKQEIPSEGGNIGKRSKGDASKTSEIPPSSVRSKDGNVVFYIVNQPEQQHRARYQTEGSRGAIKDRSGSSYPSIKLDGYNKSAKIQIFIGSDSGKANPHLFYQVCRVTGKHSSPCEEQRLNGTDIIEIVSDPGTDNMIICDCVGILKERFSDVEQRFPKYKNWKNSKKKSTKCRMVFRTSIENTAGETEVLQIVSDVINCTQLPGTPEILKMSLTSAAVSGGEELWIIGKNFLKDTKVVFSHSTPGKEEPLWSQTTDPEPDFFHQTHLITRVPPFYNPLLTASQEICVYISCGDKLSDPVSFSFTPNPTSNGQAPQPNPGLVDMLPKGVSEPAVAINNQFAQTGSISVITGMNQGPVTQVTNGDATSHHHKNKKSRMDINNKINRRTRSVPRPNLIEEDTIFATEGDFKKSVGVPGSTSTATSFSQFPWKETVSTVSATQPVRNQEQLFPSFSNSNAMRIRSSVSCSVDEDSVNLNNTRDENHDETSFHSPPRVDFTSNLTRDFSGAFNIKSSEETPQQRLSFAGALLTQSSPMVSYDQMSTTATSSQGQFYLPAKVETIPPTIPENSAVNALNSSNDFHEAPSVSVTKSKEEEKATISISLPTSILKDQKHFQSVIETINNTLLTKNTNEEKSDAVQVSPGNGSDWGTGQGTGSSSMEPVGSPCRKITSMPVSVLSNTRKRNISSELISPNMTQNQENLNTLNQYSEHLTPLSPVTSIASQTAYQQSITSPISTQQQQQQENKWNEYSQVLQTVIEQQQQQQQQCGVVNGEENNMVWTQDIQEQSSMDWSNNAIVSSVATSVTSQNYVTITTVTSGMTHQSLVSLPANNNSGVSVTNTGAMFLPMSAPTGSDTTGQSNVSVSDAGMFLNSTAGNQGTSCGASASVTNDGSLFLTSSQQLVMSPPSEQVIMTTPQVAATTTTSSQPLSNQLSMAGPAVDDFLKGSPAPSYSSYNSPITSISNPASVEQTSDPLLFEDMTPIQGDPLLSEASSVIDIQKTIENAGTEQPGPSLVSEIPSDQQWVNTPQSSEWT